MFRHLGESYGQLYRSSFNADPVSLQNIEMYPYTLILSLIFNYSIPVFELSIQEHQFGLL